VSFAARAHVPTAPTGTPLPALGLFYVDAYASSGSVSGSISFNSDGTITSSDGGYSGPVRWYTSTVVGIGASYQVRFTLSSGNDWDEGLFSGTAYSLSSARTLTWTSGAGVLKNASVAVEILEVASGAVVTTGTLVVEVESND
jgi:hypothetical protein